jgi:hypothetical protein
MVMESMSSTLPSPGGKSEKTYFALSNMSRMTSAGTAGPRRGVEEAGSEEEKKVRRRSEGGQEKVRKDIYEPEDEEEELS